MKKRIVTLLTAAVITVMSCGMYMTTAYAVNVSDSKTNTAESRPTATSKASATDKPESTAKTSSSAKPTATSKISSTSKPESTSKATSTDKPESTEDPEAAAADEEEATPEPLPTITPAPQKEAGFFGTEVTRGGLWTAFILLVIINAVISFLISSRFAALSKKDNHLSAEIRALRRDIDAKMAGTVGGFRENDTVIINRNKDYTNGAGVKTDRKPQPRVVTEDGEPAEDSIPQEAIDLYAKWESQLERSNERAERNRNLEVRSNKGSKNASTADKAKNVIKNIFPFGGDDE